LEEEEASSENPWERDRQTETDRERETEREKEIETERERDREGLPGVGALQWRSGQLQCNLQTGEVRCPRQDHQRMKRRQNWGQTSRDIFAAFLREASRVKLCNPFEEQWVEQREGKAWRRVGSYLF
jgi:hypothetical protein